MQDNENLGEFLAGDRIENSPYKIEMKKDKYCEQLCISHLGRVESKGLSLSKIIRAIHKDYHDNWIVDNLPSASKMEDDKKSYTKYFHGFPIGFVGEDKLSYINNHVNIELEYHQYESGKSGENQEAPAYRIVRFTVEPFSIKHNYTPNFADDDDGGDSEKEGVKKATLKDPIASCDYSNANREHTNYNMVTHNKSGPQLASGQVLFTYDVI